MSRLVIHDKTLDGTYYSNTFYVLDDSKTTDNYFNMITHESLATSPTKLDSYKIVGKNRINIVVKDIITTGTHYLGEAKYNLYLTNLIKRKNVRSFPEMPTNRQTGHLAIIHPSIGLDGIYGGNNAGTVSIVGPNGSDLGYVNQSMTRDELYLVFFGEMGENAPNKYYFFSTSPRR